MLLCYIYKNQLYCTMIKTIFIISQIMSKACNREYLTLPGFISCIQCHLFGNSYSNYNGVSTFGYKNVSCKLRTNRDFQQRAIKFLLPRVLFTVQYSSIKDIKLWSNCHVPSTDTARYSNKSS